MSGNQGTITFDGETKSAREWGEEYDISASTIQTRLAKGWTPFEAITTPSDTSTSRLRDWDVLWPEDFKA